MATHHKIIIGDSRRMTEIPDESIHLVITSPPYWQLKDYGNENQIGFHDTYESYINNLNLVWKECFRVLHKGCRLCINIGDQFARSVYYGRYKVIPIRTEITKFCETIGMDYMGAIIWQKVTTTNTTGGASIMGSFPYPRNGILKIDYEFILIFKKLGESPKVSKEIKELSKLTTDEWNTYFAGHWNFAGERQDKHLAMFPEELPRRLIRMFSFVGDTVLDPFLGSGTTSLAAKNLNRNSVGYERNNDFITMIKHKLGWHQIDIHGIDYEFIIQEEKNIDYDSEIKLLPYVFRDTHGLDKKIDPRKLQFGSKIDKNGSSKREDLLKVNYVESIKTIVLENDLKVNLIGIEPYPPDWRILGEDVNSEGKKFLEEKFRHSKVYLKFDKEKYDRNGNLRCYVYLENRTFINAHLLKNGFAGVDTKDRYGHYEKFCRIVRGRDVVIKEKLKELRLAY
ncbi:MAG: thermonuclease family protein [Bacteroidetes bacterium]|nr:thermonuclease family protein [Bacteroidota bacterium]MBU1421641.1 thermonuclease family protein [Bacteroidota bacterium]